MAQRGRRPLVRGVFDFEVSSTPVPREVVLDTSFVVNALVRTETHHTAARDFVLRMVDADTTVVYNRLLEIELAEVAFKIAVIEQHGRNAWPSKRHDGRVRRRAGRLSSALLGRWTDLLGSLPHACIALEEVAVDVPRLMSAYGLGSMDAAHVATALYAGVPAFVTNDAGFGCVPARSLTLYVDTSRVRSCRRRRGGR